MAISIRLILSAFAGLFIFTASCLAQSEEDKIALARSYLSNTILSTDEEELNSEAIQPYLHLMQAINQDITIEQERKVRQIYFEFLKNVYSEMNEISARDLAKTLTYEELKALDSFYSSPIGRSITKKEHVYRDKLYSDIHAHVRKKFPHLQKAIRALGLKTE